MAGLTPTFSTGRWLALLFVGAMVLVALGIWQILDRARTGPWLILIAMADVAVVVSLVLRADGRREADTTVGPFR